VNAAAVSASGAGGAGDHPSSVATDTADTPRDGPDGVTRDSRADVVLAYVPYLIIIAVFTIANLGPIKTALTKHPWSYAFHWPGLDILSTAGKPVSSMTFTFAWLSTPGTLMIISGILTAIALRLSPDRIVRAYAKTYVELRWAIVTVMAVLALAYVLNQSGQTNTLSALLATAGTFFVFLSPILGWLGVAVTGSDTSSNALFGALQVQTAARAGLDPLLLASGNSSGGVLGKMISPQNLAIAAGAVGLAGREGDIFRKVFGWSLALLLFMCVLVALQGSPVLGWMVP
jgi:lactate permease